MRALKEFWYAFTRTLAMGMVVVILSTILVNHLPR